MSKENHPIKQIVVFLCTLYNGKHDTTRHEEKEQERPTGGLEKKGRGVLRPHGENNRRSGERAENIAERRDYRALERRHGGAARARDKDVAKCAAETEARQSAESLAEERKLSMETEERLRLDTAAKLSEER